MITIIHVNTERTWRGGERQVFELVSRLPGDEFRSVVAAPFKSALMDRIRESGIPAVPLRSTGELSLRQYFDLKQASEHFKADLFHVHTSHGLVSAGCVRDRSRHPMHVVYSRRTDFHLRTGFLGISRRKYLWGADRIVSVSNAIKNVLITDGIPADRITTVYSGIDLTRFDPEADGTPVRDELGIPPDAYVVGMVAALAPHKDPATYLRAAEIIGRMHPHVCFLLVGAGSLWEEISGLKHRSGLGDRFIMTG
nr:glycosyltransferase [bacterium]